MNHKPCVTFITGFEKNCGKTTFLNYLLKDYNKHKKVACASVGLTSSSDNFLNLSYKPEVDVKKDWLIVTNTLFLNQIEVPFIIQDIIDEEVGGGKPVVIKPLYDCSIKLFSPGSNSKVFDVIEKLMPYTEYFFIDGAFDRITQVSSFSSASFYYVISVRPDNLHSVVEKVFLFEDFIKVPINDNNYDFMKDIKEDVIYRDVFFTKGIFGYEKLEKISKNIKKIFIMDFTKVFLNLSDWLSLREKFSVFFASSFKLNSYVINLYDIGRDEFEKMIPASAKKKIIYNPYES